MIKKRTALVWIIMAFLIGVIACHLFYYSSSYLSEERIKEEIERLKEESGKTRQELDKIDSLLNKM